MRIAYIADWNMTSMNGVIIKILSQTSHWIKLGCEVKLFIMSEGSYNDIVSEAKKQYIHIELVGTAYKLHAKFGKILALNKLYNAVDEFKPDVVYYREASYTPGILRVLQIGQVNIIEINSLSDYYIRDVGIINKLYNYITSNLIISKCNGLICVTEEIKKIYSKRGKLVDVIANGYDIDYSVIKNVSPVNERTQIAMVVSEDVPWHGVDKLIKLSLLLPECDFHVYGINNKNNIVNLFFYGPVSKSRLSMEYLKLDIGIGTLALHRKKMTEACPLKVREYVAYGIPVIASYKDTDLAGQEFFLELPNTEEGLFENIDKIRSFIELWKGRRIPKEKINMLIDNRVKEMNRLAFFSRVLSKKNNDKL